jgi:hypothetical protein
MLKLPGIRQGLALLLAIVPGAAVLQPPEHVQGSFPAWLPVAVPTCA